MATRTVYGVNPTPGDYRCRDGLTIDSATIPPGSLSEIPPLSSAECREMGGDLKYIAIGGAIVLVGAICTGVAIPAIAVIGTIVAIGGMIVLGFNVARLFLRLCTR